MFYDIFKKLCDDRGIKPGPAAEACGINRSNVSLWKSKGYTPRGEALQSIANYFDVSVNYLLDDDTKEKPPALTKKDERDISKKLEETLSQLESGQDGLMFDGEPMDDVTRELLLASLKNSMEMGKKIAKQKYTPKKYR